MIKFNLNNFVNLVLVVCLFFWKINLSAMEQKEKNYFSPLVSWLKKEYAAENAESKKIKDIPNTVLFNIFEYAIIPGKISELPERYENILKVNKQFNQALTQNHDFSIKLKKLIEQVKDLRKNFKGKFDADIEARNKFGISSVEWAVKKNYFELTEFLIKKGLIYCT